MHTKKIIHNPLTPELLEAIYQEWITTDLSVYALSKKYNVNKTSLPIALNAYKACKERKEENK